MGQLDLMASKTEAGGFRGQNLMNAMIFVKSLFLFNALF